MKFALHLCLLYIIAFTVPLSAQLQSRTLVDRILDGDTALAPATVSSSALAHPDDIYWDSRFGMPGVDYEVRAITVNGDWVYIGGLFTYAGNIQASHIARWNMKTHRWEALGSGVNSVVLAIGVKGDSVIVGGQFTEAGGKAATNIAVWNAKTREWSAMGQGGTGDLQAYVSAIAVSGEDVYVGGRFTVMGTLIANNVAKWDGNEWSRLGAGVNLPVNSLLVDGSDVYAGGDFTVAGTNEAAHVARWDGSRWSAVGEGFDQTVYSLAMVQDTLYAGGSFGMSGSTSTKLVAWWNKASSAWQSLGPDTTFLYPDQVYAMTAQGDSLVVAGQFLYDTRVDVGTQSKAAMSVNVAIWANHRWQGLHTEGDDDILMHTVGNLPPKGFPPIPSPTKVYALATSGELMFLGGTFPAAYYAYGVSTNPQEYSLGLYPQTAMHIVAWSIPKQRWIEMGAGPSNTVNTLLADNGSIYAGGAFTSVAGQLMPKVAQWNNGMWSPVGSGLSSFAQVEDGVVNDLAADDNRIYAAGRFGKYGDNVAVWNSSAWTDLPITKVAQGTTVVESVGAVAVFRGQLYHGRKAGLMRWDNAAWTSESIPVLPDAGVTALLADGDRYLYAGTHFGVYRWDGSSTSWATIGGTDDTVMTIVLDNDRIYIGGRFTKVDNLPVKYIARYDIESKTWTSVGNGVDRLTDPLRHPFVASLALSNGRLYAGGLFQTAGEIIANNVAVWDGEVWSSLGSGVDTAVNAIVVNGDDVYLGGAFRVAGSTVPSWYFAHWNATQLSVGEHTYAGSVTDIQVRVIPNPVNGHADIRYRVPTGGAGQPVSLTIHDILGREVIRVMDEQATPSLHSVAFDATSLLPGIYYCRLQSGNAIAVTRITVTR